MKVIDLLNKIANGEEVPNKIKYENKMFEFDRLERQYTHHNQDYSINDDLSLYFNDGIKYLTLNDEVEIIEEDKEDNFSGWKMYQDGKEVCEIGCSQKEDKKIEKLGIINYCTTPVEDILRNKIDEIIDKLNEMSE